MAELVGARSEAYVAWARSALKVRVDVRFEASSDRRRI